MKKLPKARTGDIVVRELDRELLIYDLKIDVAYNLNETSMIIFNFCNGKNTIDELKQQYQFNDDLIFFALDELSRRDLLESKVVSPFDGMNRREIIRKIGFASLVALPVISSLIAPTSAQAASACSGTIAPNTPFICTRGVPGCEIDHPDVAPVAGQPHLWEIPDAGVQTGAIDSTTILTKFNAVLNDRSGASKFEDATFNLDKWISSYLHKEGGLQVPNDRQQKQFLDFRNRRAPVDIALAPSFKMLSLFDLRKAWERIKNDFMKFDGEHKFQPTVSDPGLWETAFTHFKIGFDEGTREVDRQLSGLNWMKLKMKYKDYVRRFGGDPNLDWNNLKIRRRYFKLLKNGYDAKGALEYIKEYVKKCIWNNTVSFRQARSIDIQSPTESSTLLAGIPFKIATFQNVWKQKGSISIN